MNELVNKEDIVNVIKILIYKEYPLILKEMKFENEDVFLEPLFFSYFNSKKKKEMPKETLKEILQGYYVKKEELKINYSFNKNKIAYIPEIGYFKKNEIEPYEEILKQGDFEIIKEVHPTQEKYFVEFYKGHVVNSHPEHNSVWKEYYEELFDAIDVIKKHLPEFYEQLVFANKKIYLHDNPKILNCTSSN